MKSIACQLLFVDQGFQRNFGLGRRSLCIGWRPDFDILDTATLLAAVNDANEQHGNHEDSAQNDAGFDST